MRRIRIMNTDNFLICDKQAGSKMQLVQLQMQHVQILPRDDYGSVMVMLSKKKEHYQNEKKQQTYINS